MDTILNIGDKVRFLNDVGGGKVSGFQKGGIVLVEDEDGFEVPVRANEVVLVSDSEKKINRQNTNTPQPQSTSAAKPVPSPILPARSKLVKEDNNDNAQSLEERIAQLERTVKKLSRRIDELEAAKSLRERLQESGMKVTKAKQGSQSQQKQSGPIEIDLHATELLETTAGMSSHDIKEYQLDVFRRTMQSHLKEKGCKLIFIHGNGDGVLRQAIISELRRNYPQCQWQDASFQQYGFGATMVTIK